MKFLKMLSRTSFICLLATVIAKPANEDLDKIIDSIFGSTTFPKRVLLSHISEGECTTPSLLWGKCVPYYQCKLVEESSTSNVAAETKEEIPCTSYIDVCCLENEAPERKKEGCGWRNPEGLGNDIGDNNLAKFGEFPWMCAINKLMPLTDAETESRMINFYLGGGSLINPSVVLTAAHVVTDPETELRVRAGDWDTQTVQEPYPYQDRDVANKVLHDKFNKGNFYYDVALLFLSKPMDITVPNVALACLPPPNEEVVPKTRCFATGWGKDKFKGGKYQYTLKKIEVPVVDSTTCTSLLRGTQLTDVFELHPSFMCAGGESGEDTCTGDGGSPLVCPIEDEEDRFVQAGIVSWGVGCGEDGLPGVYAKVSNFRKWIDDKVVEEGYDTLVYSAQANTASSKK